MSTDFEQNPTPPGEGVATLPPTATAPVDNLGTVLADAVAPWPTSAGALVDKDGRPFTPGLHLTKKDGSAAVNPRSGKLYLLPKDKRTVELTSVNKNPANLRPAANAWDRDDEEQDHQEEAHDEPVSDEPPQTEEEKQAGATANAEVLVELWQLSAAVFFGVSFASFEPDPLTGLTEDKKLYETGRRWCLATGRTRPGSSLLMHVVHGVRYILRVAAKLRGVEGVKA